MNGNIRTIILIFALFAMFGCTEIKSYDTKANITNDSGNVSIAIAVSETDNINTPNQNNISNLPSNQTLETDRTPCPQSNESTKFIWLSYLYSNETQILNESGLHISFEPYISGSSSFDILGDRWELVSTWSRKDWYTPYNVFNISNKSFAFGKKIDSNLVFLNQSLNGTDLRLQYIDITNQLASFVSNKDNKTLTLSSGEIKQTNNSYVYIQGIGSSYSGQLFVSYYIFSETVTHNEVEYILINSSYNRTYVKSITIPKNSSAFNKIKKTNDTVCKTDNTNQKEKFLWINYGLSINETQILNQSGLYLYFTPSAPIGNYIDILGEKWMFQYLLSSPYHWTNFSFVLGKPSSEGTIRINETLNGTDFIVNGVTSDGVALLVSNKTNNSFILQSSSVSRIEDKYIYAYLSPGQKVYNSNGFYYLFSRVINISEVNLEIGVNISEWQYGKNIKSIFIPRNSSVFGDIFNNSR